MTDFAFDPDPIVLSGDDRAIKVVNDGTVKHDLLVAELGKGTPELDPGEELTIDFAGQPAGTYQVVCHIDGHSEAGMVTELTIRSEERRAGKERVSTRRSRVSPDH